MDFSVAFTLDPFYKELIDAADEFDIAVNDSHKGYFEKLVTFCKTYPEKRVNIHWKSRLGVDPSDAKKLSSEVDNAYFCLNLVDLPKTEAFRENGVKFYFCQELSASNFSRLKSLIEFGATDVYINDDLCYNLDIVSAYCRERGVRIRWVLNRVQNTLVCGKQYTVAFIRPNNMQDYSKYIDVGEFDCGSPENYDFKTAKVYYRCWYKKHDWFGNLQEIIHSLPFELYNAALPHGAFSRKQNCRLKCVSENSPCNRCQLECELSTGLAMKNIRFPKDRRVHDNDSTGTVPDGERDSESDVPQFDGD